MTPDDIVVKFGLAPADYTCDRITSGHINFTYKLTGKERSYILQRINKNVFQQPEVIASNLRHAAAYLKSNNPDYLFLESLPAKEGTTMIYDHDGFPWRLFPFIDNTTSIDKIETAEEAYSAAFEFGRLTACLWNDDITRYQETIPGFHDLASRYEQFEQALRKSSDERKATAAKAIAECISQAHLVVQYKKLIESGRLLLKVMHNDTKVNNILFDRSSRQAVCVIDLDTLMPGYFIYDLGDMIRTFVSPVSEEEKDVTRIVFRREIYYATIGGYFKSMNHCLTPQQQSLAAFAGQMMTYIMALRFLADYLQGDTYYQTHYPGQNLVRATNQLQLISILQTELT